MKLVNYLNKTTPEIGDDLHLIDKLMKEQRYQLDDENDIAFVKRFVFEEALKKKVRHLNIESILSQKNAELIALTRAVEGRKQYIKGKLMFIRFEQDMAIDVQEICLLLNVSTGKIVALVDGDVPLQRETFKSLVEEVKKQIRNEMGEKHEEYEI